VTSRLGTGKPLTFFTVYAYTQNAYLRGVWRRREEEGEEGAPACDWRAAWAGSLLAR